MDARRAQCQISRPWRWTREPRRSMTTVTQQEDLLVRHAGNPILTAAQWPYRCATVFNPGATRLANGDTILLVRVEDRRGHSHLCVARSHDGITDWEIDAEPTLPADPTNHPEEVWGIEDPRITLIPELERYAILYTAYSRGGPGVSLALTEDFRAFERRGGVAPPHDKDAALFPRRFDGQWVMIHRPVSDLGAHMWLSYSPDLLHWGNHRLLLEARRGAWWDANKIGLSPPPLETPEGWLVMYHGVRMTGGGCLYRLGLALLDLEEPERVIARGHGWMFGPEAAYEREGDVGNVVFPCGYTIGDDGDTLNVYYGAADTSIALATGRISEMLAWLKEDAKRATSRVYPL
jgi:predicted GH43/DUF377 family glycosyl hydrolase